MKNRIRYYAQWVPIFGIFLALHESIMDRPSLIETDSWWISAVWHGVAGGIFLCASFC